MHAEECSESMHDDAYKTRTTNSTFIIGCYALLALLPVSSFFLTYSPALFFTCSKKSVTTCEKQPGMETGNEANSLCY